MIINGKEYGIAYDNLTIANIAEELGFEDDINQLNEAYQKAFNSLSDGRITTGYIKIQIALIFHCLNRWCKRNKKDYRISEEEVVDMNPEEAVKIFGDIFKHIAENSPKPKNVEKSEEPKKK